MSVKKWAFIFTVIISAKLFPQGEAAMPFLLHPISPKLNGAGATGTATLVDDPYKFFFNPAHLGFSSKTENFSSGFFPQKTEPLEKAYIDYTFNSYVFTGGFNLQKIYPNLPVTIGAGFSRTEMNYGFSHSIESREYYSSYSFGVGYHSVVNVSAGFTVKDVTSILIDQPTISVFNRSEANVTALDYGLLVNIPLNNILKNPLRFHISEGNYLNTNIDYTLGYTLQNVGDKVYYVDPAQADPIGRTARLAHNLQLDLNLQSDKLSLGLVNLSYSIDAEDILIKSEWDSTTGVSTREYQGLLGDIKPLKNLFLGQGDQQVVLHKGLTLEFLEAITIVTGGFDGQNIHDAKTDGFGLRSRGLLKLINIFSESETLKYIINHFDIQYINTNYLSGSPVQSKYSGLIFTMTGY